MPITKKDFNIWWMTHDYLQTSNESIIKVSFSKGFVNILVRQSKLITVTYYFQSLDLAEGFLRGIRTGKLIESQE